jgi:copper oxidase (laccase) domain-containing protein
VLESTLDAMEALGARRARILTAVGPCIGLAAYEVGWDFQKQFLAQDSASLPYFSEPQTGSKTGARPHFDLAAYAVHRLARAGVAGAGKIGSCTYARGEDFFSYRRSQAAREPDYGRQISAIVLT